MSIPRPHGEPFPGGDVLYRLPPGGAVALRIESPREKRGWRARVPGDQLRASHAGTAVLFEEALYEVVSARPAEDGRLLYELAPWDDTQVMAPPQSYSREACTREVEAHRLSGRERQLASLAHWLSPLVSLLPAAEQAAIERRFGLAAAANSRRWAFGLASACGLGMMVGFWQTAHHQVTLLTEHRLLVAYLLAESLFRFLVAGATWEPIGSLLSALPLGLWRLLRSRRSAEQAVEAATRQAQERRFSELESAVDTVERAEDESGAARLIVTSALPKDHWTLFKTAVRYQEESWLPVEREVLAAGDEAAVLGGLAPVHRFVLEPLDELQLVTSCVDYDPSEVQTVHRERLRHRYEAWVLSLATLWGALDWPLKQSLERAYAGFDATRSTRESIVLLSVLGLPLVLGGLARLMSGELSVGAVASFGVGLFLILEGCRRWVQLGRGGDRGSVLGLALAPWARLLARVGPRS